MQTHECKQDGVRKVDSTSEVGVNQGIQHQEEKHKWFQAVKDNHASNHLFLLLFKVITALGSSAF